MGVPVTAKKGICSSIRKNIQTLGEVLKQKVNGQHSSQGSSSSQTLDDIECVLKNERISTKEATLALTHLQTISKDETKVHSFCQNFGLNMDKATDKLIFEASSRIKSAGRERPVQQSQLTHFLTPNKCCRQ